MFTKTLRFLRNEIIFNGHIQSLGAASVAYVASQVLLDRFTLSLFLVTYLIFQLIYLNDRYMGMKEDKTTNTERVAHLQSYVDAVPIIMLFWSLVTVSGILYFSNIPTLIFAGATVLMGTLYPVYFKNLTKNIYLFKNVYVSVVYASLVYFVFVYFGRPVHFNGASITLSLFVFTELMIGQIILDLKDIESDRKIKLLTLPVVLGKDKTLTIVNYIALTSAFLFGFLSVSVHIQALMPLVISTLFINLLALYKINDNALLALVMQAGKPTLWIAALDLAKSFI